MARFTDSQLNKLKTDISLVRLILSQGYKLVKKGSSHEMNCPFHDDATPSLKVSESKNVFNCFGCGESGTVIDWIMKTQSVSFRHACEILMNDASMDLDEGNVVGRSSIPKLDSPLTAGADNNIILVEASNYYNDTLKQSTEALDYLKSRGLTHPELIDHFRLGFVNRTLGFRLPAKNRVEGKLIRAQLQDVGLLRVSGHEHFNGSIVVPIMDKYNKVYGMYGRKIRNNLRKGTPKHLYLPGEHKGVFNIAGLKLDMEVILCESIIDALTFWNHGFRNVTCSYGTGGFTDDIMQAFKANNIKRVLIAYDRDEAGSKAAKSLSKKLNAQNFDSYRILFPKGMDANEYALNVNSPQQALAKVIRTAQWLGNGVPPAIIDNTTKKQKVTSKAEPAKPAIPPSSNKTTEVSETYLAVKGESHYPLTANEPAPEPKARVMPDSAGDSELDDLSIEVDEHEVDIQIGTRTYRVRGMNKNMSYEQLKINLLVSCDSKYYIDVIDLYHAKARASYIKMASVELGMESSIIKKDLGKILMRLELLQEEQILAVHNKQETTLPTLTELEYQDAMELLKAPNLLDRITEDLTMSGIIGENTNKLTAYLGCVSRKLDKPLAIIIQSTSAAGKSTLMDAVIEMMPENEKVQYSAMTGQSLFYMGETSLKNKILAISEEEGAHNASYALKLLQSEGKITIASTGKDEASGNMETKEYSVQGPVMLFMTTTAIDIDEELMNRCLVLTVNESREQTQAIHNMQRESRTLDGLLRKQSKNKLITLHQNAMSLIKQVQIVNPYAQELTFISDKTRTRRDHMKYLSLIDTIALLHQHQREIKSITRGEETISYIEVEKSDIAMANKLAHEVLGRSLDELPPQSRNLLNEIHQLITANCKKEGIDQGDYYFTRKMVRDATNWGNTQLKVHLARLEDMEYLLIHKGGRGQSIVYELLYKGEGNNGKSFMLGLKNMDKYQYDAKQSGVNQNRSASSRAQVAPKSAGCRGKKNTLKANDINTSKQSSNKAPKNTRLGLKKTNHASHRNVISGAV